MNVASGPRRHRHSIATVALGGTLGEKLAAAAAAGFDGVELFEPDLIAAPLTPEEVRRRLADLGLVLELYQPLRDIEAVPPEVFQRKLRLVSAKFDLMQRLGARMALLCSNVSAQAIDDDDLAAEQLAAVADEAQRRGLTVAYEALAWGAHVSDYVHSWEVVKRAGHPALGICLDSFHILARGTSLAGITAIPPDKLFILQLADAPRLRMDELQWSRHYRCFPGQGAFDLGSFLRRVLAAGYAGPLSLEIFNDIFRQADPFRTAVDGRRSLLWLEERADASAPSDSGPGAAWAPVSRLPAGASDLRGFAFVELDAPPETTKGLTRLLTGLGLRRTGVHRSKPVELWEASEARILVNSGRRSVPAHTRFSVTAVGLDVAVATPVARRAAALRTPPVPRHRNWDEADLVGLEAPGGVEIFLCEDGSPWRGDFDPCTDEYPFSATARLAGIDHVAFAQPLTLFNESVLFYRSLLGLVPLESQEVASPNGLIRSQALAGGGLAGGALAGGALVGAAGGETVRFVINVPVLGGGRAESHPVQHVAIRSDDIVETARAVSAQGLSVLPVPGNYYEDLAARLGLDAASLEAYRRYGILYDEDSAGRVFRQFYVTAPQSGVLFEIVDRTPGYAGYGAANALVRMAAQETAPR
ncbi:MAG TPA: TIM barrel protein [Trebonia sp.]|nr:TIM barrel protein [Trebonia sp.]